MQRRDLHAGFLDDSKIRRISYKLKRRHKKPLLSVSNHNQLKFSRSLCRASRPMREATPNVHNDRGEHGAEEACDWLLSAVALVILL